VWSSATLGAPSGTALQDKEFSYFPLAIHPDGVELLYSVGPLPGWLAFDPGEPVRCVLAGVASALL
jgi:hypothetical protein